MFLARRAYLKLEISHQLSVHEAARQAHMKASLEGRLLHNRIAGGRGSTKGQQAGKVCTFLTWGHEVLSWFGGAVIKIASIFVQVQYCLDARYSCTPEDNERYAVLLLNTCKFVGQILSTLCKSAPGFVQGIRIVDQGQLPCGSHFRGQPGAEG